MKNVFIIDEKNITLFSPYQGNDQKLEIGDRLQICSVHVPCVYKQKGMKQTFSIYTGKILSSRYPNETNLTAYTWMYNRFAINDKFTR